MLDIVRGNGSDYSGLRWLLCVAGLYRAIRSVDAHINIHLGIRSVWADSMFVGACSFDACITRAQRNQDSRSPTEVVPQALVSDLTLGSDSHLRSHLGSHLKMMKRQGSSQQKWPEGRVRQR